MAKTAIDDLAIVISADASGLASDLRSAAKMAEDFARRVNKGSAGGMFGDSAREAAAYKRAAREAGEAAKKAGETGGMSFLKMTGATFAANAALMGIQATGLGLIDVFDHIKDSVKMAADLEQTKLGFEVMLGSAEQASQLIAGLRKFAAETPFSQKEVTNAGKQLLAYGIAADQIIPTLKVLGDVSAGFGSDLPIKDLTYLYGTLYAQQRAYAVDIRQFAGRGIPIYEELAKVLGKSVADLKEMVEAGRISSDDVTRAFVSMTSAGGKFHDMTKRQSQTLRGLWEQATDAFDLAKTKLGEIIVQEAGLKDVVRDLEGFGKRLELGIDTKDIRGTIRFIADAAKGVVQVGYEFSKAFITGGDVFFQMAREVPSFKQAFEAVGSIITGMKDFKLDPEKIVDVSIGLAKGILGNTATLLVLFAEAGTTFRNDFYEPLKDLIKDFQELNKVGKGFGGGAGRPLLELGLDAFRQQQLAVDLARGKPVDLEFKPRNDPFDYLRNIASTLTGTFKDLDKAAAEVKEKFKKEAFEKAEKLRQDAYDAATAKELARTNAMAGAYSAIRESSPKADIGLLAALGGGPNPLVALASGAKGFRSEFAATAAPESLAKLLPFYFSGMRDVVGLRTRGLIDPGALDLKKQLREKFDPLAEGGEFRTQEGYLKELLKRGEITKEMHDLGYHDLVQGVATRLGIGPTQLPETALKGSAEAQRIINQFQAGGQQTTEDLLRQILETLRARGTQARDYERRMVESSNPVNPFGPAGW